MAYPDEGLLNLRSGIDRASSVKIFGLRASTWFSFRKFRDRGRSPESRRDRDKKRTENNKALTTRANEPCSGLLYNLNSLYQIIV